MLNNDILKGLSFDSSLSNIDATISSSDYVERLISLLQPILEQRFPGNLPKQKIQKHVDRITIACPVCGDSMKNNYKKRGNIILKGKFKNHYKCFNCGEFKRIDHFLSDYKITLSLDVINYIANDLEDFSKHTDTKYDMSLFLDMGDIESYAIERGTFLKYFGLSEIDKEFPCSWLLNRHQRDFSKFMYNKSKNYLVLLNLTQSGKILGVQKRMFSGNSKYLTYKLSKLYELMSLTNKISEEIDALSQIFNICLIDFSKEITLFEGPFDSFLFKNSIANTGANKTFPFDVELRYLYDNDKTGTQLAIQHLNKGDKIFLWQKFLNAINAPHRTKWDWNDIIVYCLKNNIKIPNVENYFTNDSLDMLDL